MWSLHSLNFKEQSLLFRQSPYFCVLRINLLHLHMVVLCTVLRGRCHISCRLKVIDHSKIIKQCTMGECCGKIIRTSAVCSELAFYSFLTDLWYFNTDLIVQRLWTPVTEQAFFFLLTQETTPSFQQIFPGDPISPIFLRGIPDTDSKYLSGSYYPLFAVINPSKAETFPKLTMQVNLCVHGRVCVHAPWCVMAGLLS